MIQKNNSNQQRSSKIEWDYRPVIQSKPTQDYSPKHSSSEKKRKKIEDNSSVALKLIFWGERNSLLGHLKKRSLDNSDWFMQKLSKDFEAMVEVFRISTIAGPEVYLCLKEVPNHPSCEHQGLLQWSTESRWRDICGLALSVVESFQLARVHLYFVALSSLCVESIGLGMELACYSQKRIYAKKNFNLEVSIQESKSSELPSLTVAQVLESFEKGQELASHVNLARYLVALPGEELNPDSFVSFIQEQVKLVTKNLDKASKISCEILDKENLQKENMGLLLGVGQGSSYGTYLVHLKYQPSSVKPSKTKMSSKGLNSQDHYVLLGKGVCFDTGGLDIKPASGMRHMKKDMGGAASVLSFFLYYIKKSPDCRLDVYLPIVENALGSKSFRPGDILFARNGMSVEIHNTDAEGRLALADAMDYALTQKDCDFKNTFVIDIATLTGAIKVGLGADIAGLFSNSQRLTQQLEQASTLSGERLWRMPLVEEYSKELTSSIADLSNASSNPFGGAITAALFLKKFIKNFRWAHLDIYAWTDLPSGALREPGSNGQGVQLLAKLFKI